jgi:hypothetical protein
MVDIWNEAGGSSSLQNPVIIYQTARRHNPETRNSTRQNPKTPFLSRIILYPNETISS